MKSNLIFWCALASLTGCAAYKAPEEASEKINGALSAHIAKRDYRDPTPNIVHFDAMYVPQLTKEEAALPDWWFKREKSVFNGDTFSSVMGHMQKTHGVNVELRPGVDDSVLVVSRSSRGTVGDVINAVRASTGYQYEINESTLVWRKYLTEVFPVRTVAGAYDFSIGKKNANSTNANTSESGTAQSTAVQASGDEFSNTSGNYNPLEDVLVGVETILGCEGQQLNGAPPQVGDAAAKGGAESFERCDYGASVSVLPSDNSLIVRALPSQLDQVREFVEVKTERDLRQIRVSMTLVTVSKNNDSSLSLDLNLQDYIDSDRWLLEAASSAGSAIVGGITDAGTVDVTYRNGTDAAFGLLSEQGDILQRSSMGGVAMNHRISVLTNVNKVSYIAERVLETTSNVGTTTGIEQEVAESGTLLYMLPNIGEHDVVLHVSSSLSDLVRLRQQGEVGNEVESPEISDRELSTVVRLEHGKPKFVGGFSIDETEALFNQSGIGFSRSSQDESVETVMLVMAEWI